MVVSTVVTANKFILMKCLLAKTWDFFQRNIFFGALPVWLVEGWQQSCIWRLLDYPHPQTDLSLAQWAVVLELQPLVQQVWRVAEPVLVRRVWRSKWLFPSCSQRRNRMFLCLVLWPEEKQQYQWKCLLGTLLQLFVRLISWTIPMAMLVFNSWRRARPFQLLFWVFTLEKWFLNTLKKLTS